jgi:alpha-beta hydrolase superfamily lysophospholipase
MAEHSARYARLAKVLTAHGYAVYANDHRGHGKTVSTRQELGHFADENGWELVVGDQLSLLDEIKSRHPDLPVFYYGHSMGSFIARCAVLRRPHGWAGLALSGTSHDGVMMGQTGRALAVIERARVGKRGKSAVLRKSSFERFNNMFPDPRTPCDWLSRDPHEVDKYVADPFCGFECSTQLWYDVFGGIVEMCTPKNLSKLPSTLPVYIMAGERDPLNNRLAHIRKLHQALEEAGVRNVTLRVYPDARHELVNETNRDEVTRDFVEWLEKQLP